MIQWQTKRLDELGKIVTGKTPASAKPEEFGDHFPFITPSDLPKTQKHVGVERLLSQKGMEAHKRILLPNKSTCVVCIGATIGKVCMTKQPSFSNQQINSIIPLEGEHDPDFIYYISTKLKDALVSFAGGAATPIVNKSVFSSIKVLVPGYEVQRKIAAILSAYDDLIENNKRRIALLEQMAEEIYREWFVRMRFSGHENTRFEKGVPEGWEINRLGSILEFCYGKALKARDRVPGNIQVYGSGGVIGTHNEALVKNSGLIIGRKGNVGSIHWSDREFFPIDTVYFVKSELPNSFLYFLLRSMNFINNDAAVPGLNRNQAYSNKFFLPPVSLIKKYAGVVDLQFEMKINLSQQNEQLSAMRESLLSRLISGKLSVEDLDIQFPPSMQEAEA